MKTIDLFAQMQAQQAKNHEDLVKVVTEGFATMASTMAQHTLDDAKQFNAVDKRLAPVESMRRTVRWAAGAVFVQLVAFVFLVAAYALHVGR